MSSLLIQQCEIDFDHQNFFLVDARLRDNLSRRIRDETLSPELDPISSGPRFEPCPVRHRDVTAVGDRMAALDCFPRRMLPFAVLLLFTGMPADSSRIE